MSQNPSQNPSEKRKRGRPRKHDVQPPRRRRAIGKHVGIYDKGVAMLARTLSYPDSVLDPFRRTAIVATLSNRGYSVRVEACRWTARIYDAQGELIAEYDPVASEGVLEDVAAHLDECRERARDWERVKNDDAL